MNQIDGNRIAAESVALPHPRTLSARFITDEWELTRTLATEQVIGVKEFHRKDAAPFEIPGAIPRIRVHMDPADHQSVAEVWTSPRPVRTGSMHGFRYASDGELLFAATSRPGYGQDLKVLAEELYDEAFAVIAELDYPQPVRIWNYFPAINCEEAALERYRAFCYGRSVSFEKNATARTGDPLRFPAGTGIGSLSGNASVALLAARRNAPRHLENPRQLPAYRYPSQYGPRSPSFARATHYLCADGVAATFVAGTASIVGHASVHEDDILAQCEETLENIRLLLDGPNFRDHGLEPGAALTDLAGVKVYVRRPADMAPVKRVCAQRLDPDKGILYLQADICRAELLVEIEGIVWH